MVKLLEEMRTRRFKWICVVGGTWFGLLLILSVRQSHGLFESAHEVWRGPFQLPSIPVSAPYSQRTFLGGTLRVETFLNSFAGSVRREWFELLLPASDNVAQEPEEFIGVENLRLYTSSGKLLCTLPARINVPIRPLSKGLGADLELSQQLEEFPVREVKAHEIRVDWSPVQSRGCPYEQPAWVVADVIRRRVVSDEGLLWLDLAHGQSTVDAGDSSMTATPGLLPGEWRIEVVNQGAQSLHFIAGDYPEHRGQRSFRYAHSASYDGAWDKMVRSRAFLAADIYHLHFNQQAPGRLPIHVMHGDEERLADIRFSVESEQRGTTSPSSWTIPLAHTEIDGDIALPGQAQGLEYHELFLPISLSAVCQLRVLEASNRPAQSLRWTLVSRLQGDDLRRYSKLPDANLDRVRWELQSPNGEQRFFHDLSVKSELRCPSNLAWQEFPYQAGDSPWLVASSVLPSDMVRYDRPARELFGRFRFLDASGRPLLPIARTANLVDPSIETFLFPGGYFKFYGEVASIEKLQILDATPRREHWTYHFMSLDVY